jgi:outer membrane lipoprotein-sorting protein
MISAMLVLASLQIDGMDPIDAAIERYRTVESYQVTLRSSRGDASDIIRYSYRRPGFVRMDFVQPHRGTVLIYSPLTGKVRLWPFGGRLFSLTLSPENRLVQSSTGQRVDRSDIGALLENVKALRGNGETKVLGEEPVNGATAVRLTVSGKGNFTVGRVHRYELWLDRGSLLPLKVVSRDLDNEIIETVAMDGLRINVGLGDELFNPN